MSMTRSAIVLGLLVTAGPLAIDMYLPAMPTIADDLSTTTEGVQATLIAYFTVFGLAQMVYGPWSDAVGRRRPLMVGLGIFALGSLGSAVATEVGTLIAARAVQAAGAASLMVVPRAVIRDMHTGPQATRLMALIMLVISVSPMLAPLIGSGLIALGDWRLIFWALAAVAVADLALVTFALPETMARRVPVDLRAMWAGARVLLTDRTFMALTFVGGFGMASFFVFLASAAFVYVEQFGLTPTGFSLAFAINALGFFAASQLAAPLGMRVGMARMVLVATLGFAAMAVLTFGAVLVFGASLPLVVGGLFLANAFLGLVVPSTMVMALDPHGEIAGLASSLGGTLQMVAGGAAVAASAPFFDGTATPMLAAIALCGVAASALALVAARPVPAVA
ncbi:multidrug effflux MFS transporter [Jannaschia sp. LMIT008]|uniref:multidrug effflux MFS transporter n=1 Tax=Jannaschia maritima TaxID=3032585 RepID=UPI0035ABF341